MSTTWLDGEAWSVKYDEGGLGEAWLDSWHQCV